MSGSYKMPDHIRKELSDMVRWEDGKPYARVKISHMQMPDSLVGSISHGYRYIGYKGYRIAAHQLRFWQEYGYLPEIVDHIDHDGDNNRLDNLRGVTRGQNCRYSRGRKHYYYEHRKLRPSYYYSRISIGGVSAMSPHFDTKYEAMSWYYTMALYNGVMEYVI